MAETNQSHLAAQVQALKGDIPHLPTGRLWQLVNEPRPVDHRAVRIGCVALLIAYVIAGVVRHDPQHSEFLWIRLVVCLYALAAIGWARQFSWRNLRAYAIGLALLLALSTAYMETVRGNQLSDLALSALTTFVPLVFLLTAADVIIAAAGLACGHALLLVLLPPGAVSVSVTGVVLGGVTAAGSVVALILITYRAQLNESLRWWRQACDRERTLRECAELAASQVSAGALLAGFANRFRSTFGGAQSMIILADPGDTSFRVVATAGTAPDVEVLPTSIPLSPPLASLLSELVRSQQPIIRGRLDAAELACVSQAVPIAFLGECVVALPITVDDVVAGAAILTAPEARVIDPDDLQLWRAMASQVGAAIGKTRLLARLQQALNAKSEFVNTLSHELRSPLNIIIGYTDMLRDGGLDPVFTAERVRASALELLQLVENTMAAARLGTGKVKLQVDEFSVDDLLGELAESVQALPEARRGVSIEWHIEPGLPRLQLDRLKLKEIIQNLVSNGLKFAVAGTVTVAVRRERDLLRLEVSDTGPGIPLAAQRRIFEMFERVERSDRSGPPGTGLGLYIVKNLVGLMNGTIELISHRGKGSSFIVHLPLRLIPAATEVDDLREPLLTSAECGVRNAESGADTSHSAPHIPHW